MKRTGVFDRYLALFLFACLAGSTYLLMSGGTAADQPLKNKALERGLAAQARLLFQQNAYGPVESLMKEGRTAEALLKLEELSARYPGEAYGLALKGKMLAESGAQSQAIASYAQAVRLNGEHVDKNSPLSRREEISRLVDSGLTTFLPKIKAQPADLSLKQTIRDLYYLKSRLAGGCE